MPRGKWIDKKTAQHFTLVHRPQNDPLIHDENAPSMVLNPIQQNGGPSKVKHLDDLASELGSEAESIRANEGEAASYGVYFDDTKYDYMQHLRDLNAGSGDVVFVESTANADKGKGKQKQSLEEALQKMDIEQKSDDLFGEEILPSRNLSRVTYEAQQDIPDSIKGFQPDMDPRLREVLEALDDEAFVDEDDDIFKQLAKDGRELDDYEFDQEQYYEDDDGWESDDTAKPIKEYKDDAVPDLVRTQAEQPEEGPSQDWMEDFKQFKKEQKGGRAPVAPSQSELQSTWTTTTNGGRRKKRKGALTDASSYSMTSSSLVRTEQMTLLDARFDKIEERYNEDFEDDMGSMSEISTASSVQGPIRSDFDGILDDFLGGYTKPGIVTIVRLKALGTSMDTVTKWGGWGAGSRGSPAHEQKRPQIALRGSSFKVQSITSGPLGTKLSSRNTRNLRSSTPPHVQTIIQMTATSVASSNLMFPAFGQATRSSAPAVHPFASQPEGDGRSLGFGGAGDTNGTKQIKRKQRFNDGDNEWKRKGANLSKDKDLDLSDGSHKKHRKSEEKKRKGADSKKPHANGDDPFKKRQPQKARDNRSNNPFESTTTASRPTSSSSTDTPGFEPLAIPHSDDPHAKRVYEQLRNDGISPPEWPSEPGNPKNKAQVSRFRERYEAYRISVRESLTKAGLIDDPNERKTLQDAIDFKGICEDMCPEYEKITRINEMDVHLPEKDPKTAYANTCRMVKKLARSAAGQEAPLPMDVRSVKALRRTLDYLIDDLLQNDGNLAHLHGFLWDRTRAIRRDFTFFSSLNPEEMKNQVYVLENIARFHVTALHLLSQEGKAPEDFVEQQELEQLGKSLLSLRDLYDDCNEQGITCENEPEFRAYYLIFHAFDSNILETLQRQWKPNLWRDSDEVRTAVSLVEALQNIQDFHGPLKDAPSLAASSAYNSYFRIVDDPKVSYTMACFAECHFPHLRRSILAAVKRSLARPRESTKDVTAEVLNKFLRFDRIEEAISFAELHDFEFSPDDGDPSNPSRRHLILDNRKGLPHHRLQHQFSRSMVEKKRGSRSLPELIHQTVYEDLDASAPLVNGSSEPSLFVPKQEPQQAAPASSLGFTNAKSSPPVFGQALSFEANQATFTNTKGTATTNGTIPTFGSAAQQSSSFPNPFATPSAQPPPNPLNNPFAQRTATSPFQSTPQLNGGISSNNEEQVSASRKSLANPFASATEPRAATGTPIFNNPFGSGIKPSTVVPNADTAATSLPSANQQEAKPQGANWLANKPLGATTGFSSAEGQKLAPTIPPTFQTTPSLEDSVGGSTSFLPAPRGPLAQQPLSDMFNTQPGANSQPEFLRPVIKNTPAMPAPAQVSNTSTLLNPNSAFPSSTASPAASPLASLDVATSVNPPITQTSLPPPESHSPPQDRMGDFAKWFVKGDDGLLEEFQVFIVDSVLQDVFAKFMKDQEKQRREEEEHKATMKAQEFRAYNLSLKYFYRWKEMAREKRLGQLRRSGRDQVRAYWEAQRAAELKAQRAAARRTAKERAQIAELNRPDEFRDLLKQKVSKRRAEQELLASGVLAGVNNEEEAAASIVRSRLSLSVSDSVASDHSKLSQSTSGRSNKTQALRERFSREQSPGFRRSLPPMPSTERPSLGSSNRSRRVSERWRLKAMGIVQMPDGTALPESLANEIRLGTKKYLGQGSGPMGPPEYVPIRQRVPGSDATTSEGQQALPSIETGGDDGAMLGGKRKRPAEDDGAAVKETGPKLSAHQRVMSDAEKLTSELRAMREEMEEGAAWFKTQNEKLQSELSRSSTPWDGSV